MNKGVQEITVRSLFCAGPALLIASVLGVLSLSFAGAVVGFFGGFCFGWLITAPRPERGEGS